MLATKHVGFYCPGAEGDPVSPYIFLVVLYVFILSGRITLKPYGLLHERSPHPFIARISSMGEF